MSLPTPEQLAQLAKLKAEFKAKAEIENRRAKAIAKEKPHPDDQLLSDLGVKPQQATHVMAHRFKLTPEMKKEILANKFPLYQTGGVVHKAQGGAVQPTIPQMKMALLRSNPAAIQSLGAQEAPDMSPKTYIPPAQQTGKFIPPGGAKLPTGGVDVNPQQPGQQLMPQQPMQQPPQQQPQAPEGMAPEPSGQPQQPQDGSNILQMTPQGQALSAMKPQQPQQPQQPQGLKDGGQPDEKTGSHKFEVSTRFPTAVKATENPIGKMLLVGMDAAKRDPQAMAHNMSLIKSYPGAPIKSKKPEDAAEEFIEHAKDNLLHLHDEMPAHIRQRSRKWYDGANKIARDWSKKYSIATPTAAGMLAALSPQKDWFMNVSLAHRLLDALHNNSHHSWDGAMNDVASRIWADKDKNIKPQYVPILNQVQGKRLSDLKDPIERAMWIRTFDQAHNPRHHMVITPEGEEDGIRMADNGSPYATGWGSLNEIAKAISMHDRPTYENISRSLGDMHKVRSFYNNILAPNSPHGHTTIDTHAVAAALLRPLSGNSREVSHNFGSNMLGEVGPKSSSVLGVNGTYPIYHEAYKRAAKERELLPREMQSITWEGIRGMFSDVFKRNEQMKHEINEIWNLYAAGKIPAEFARALTQQLAGGINVPEWHK